MLGQLKGTTHGMAEFIRRLWSGRRKHVQLGKEEVNMSRASRANDAELAKWLEAVLCGDETDMVGDTREAEQCWFRGPPWTSR